MIGPIAAGILEISYGAMWLLLIANTLLVLLLYRHFGLMSMETFEGVQRDGLPIGDEAPTLFGVTASGQEMALSPGNGKSSFLLFAAPECGPCKDVAPYVNRLSEVVRGQDAALDISVIAAGDQAAAVRVSENFDPSFTTIADDGATIFETYRVRVTPFAFVVDEQRRVRAKGLCGDSSRLRELLRSAGLPAAAAEIEEPKGLDEIRQADGAEVLEQGGIVV